MQETRKSEENQDTKNVGLNKAGDPGSTPSQAEGDRETVEADLKEKEQEGFFDKNQKNNQ